MIDVILCELEGVVAETSAPRQRALAHAFAAEGLSAPAAGESPIPVRAAVERAMRAAGAAHDATLVDLLTDRAERQFATEAATGLSLASGARDTIASLQARTRLAVVTRLRRDDAERILALAALDGAFEVIVAAEDVLEPKPHPEGYLAALARLTRRRPVARALAIEDGVSGARAARAAGLPCLLVGDLAAHEALEAGACIPWIAGQTIQSLSALSGARSTRVA